MPHKMLGRSVPRVTMEHSRFRALELRNKGWKVKDIAESLGVHPNSVSRWFVNVSLYGKESLKLRKAPGRKSILDTNDKTKIITMIRKPATEFQFETPLWTVKRVQQLIQSELGKKIAISNLWEALRKWRLSPQVPERESLDKNDKEVKKWLKETWPEIKEHRRRWQAMLYFMDESGVSLSPVLGKTWAPVGKTPKIRVTGKRGGFCVSSAISPIGKMVFRIEKEKVNRYTFTDFLLQIMNHHPHRKIIIICDNAPPHIAKYIHEFVISNKNRIAVYYIPTYSPELNPDEDVWRYLKNVKLKAHQARNKEEFKPLLLNKMRGIQKSPATIRSFFNDSILT